MTRVTRAPGKPSMVNLSAKKTSGRKNPELEALLSLGELENVPLDHIDRDEFQPRPIEEVMEGINDFADELERDNFQLAQFPVFNIEDNGRRTIVVGERRVTGFRIKGQKTIPAVCKKFSEEERKKIFILQYVENDGELKKPLSPMADARWWRTYVDRYHDGNVSEAAKSRGRTIPDISNRLSLLEAAEPVKEFASRTAIRDPATFASLARIAKLEGDEAAATVIAQFENGEISGSFRDHVQTAAKESRQKIKGAPAKTKSVKGAGKGTKIEAGLAQADGELGQLLKQVIDLASRALQTHRLNQETVKQDLIDDLEEAISVLTQACVLSKK